MKRSASTASAAQQQQMRSSTASSASTSKILPLLLMRFFLASLLLVASVANARELRSTRIGPCAPTEVHLALTDTPSTLRVLWSSVSPDCAPQLELGVLRSGVEDDEVARELQGIHNSGGENPTLSSSSPSSSLSSPSSSLSSSLDQFFSFVSADVEATLERASYSSADLCGPPASRNDGNGEKNLYAAELRGLEPGKLHAYRLSGSSDSSDPSSSLLKIEATFRAPPVASPTSGATVLVFGDMGDAQHPRGKDPGARLVADAVAAAVDEATWRGEREVIDPDDSDSDADDSEDLSLSSLSRRRRRGGTGGRGEGQKKKKSFPAGGPPLVLNVGDISYADGDPRGWERFMAQVQASASRAPYGVAAGNHDVGWEEVGGEGEEETEGSEQESRRKCDGGGGIERRRNVAVRDAAGFSQPYLPDWGDGASAAFGPDSRGECGVPMAARFAAFGAPSKSYLSRDDDDGRESNSSSSSCFPPLGRPRPPPPSDPTQPVRPFWYAFDHGPIHFVVVSTEHSLEPGSRQREWLEGHLRLRPDEEGGIDRCRTPWVALAAHRPMYVPYPHKSNRLAGERLRQSLEPLVDVAGFDLVLSGHVHSFARSCNAAGLRCVPRSSGGAVHYTLGCGGRKLSGIESVTDQPSWISAAENRWGFLRIDADGGGGSLTASFVRASDGSVGDSVVLYGTERPPLHACRGGFGGSIRGNASYVVEVA